MDGTHAGLYEAQFNRINKAPSVLETKENEVS